MKRDFSSTAKTELINAINQVEDEKWSNFTDWFGDRWYDFEDLIGVLDAKKSIDNINSYHKKVLDKNNTSKTEIDNIFNSVYNVSSNYSVRFSAVKSQFESFNKLILEMGELINPNNGYTPKEIKDSLSRLFADYDVKLDIFGKLQGEGLSEDDLDMYDENVLGEILDYVADSIIDNIPSIKVGQEASIPIGVGLTFFYKVSTTLKGSGDATINATIDEQKIELKNVSWKKSAGGELLSGDVSVNSDEEASASINSPNTSTSFDNNGFSGSTSYKFGKNTYTFETSYGVNEFTIQESVKTDLGGDSITTTIGIKKSNETNWKPLPAPEPVYNPSPIEVPTLNVDWEKVATVTAVVSVVAIAAGIILAVPTGGTSLVLCAI